MIEQEQERKASEIQERQHKAESMSSMTGTSGQAKLSLVDVIRYTIRRIAQFRERRRNWERGERLAEKIEAIKRKEEITQLLDTDAGQAWKDRHFIIKSLSDINKELDEAERPPLSSSATRSAALASGSRTLYTVITTSNGPVTVTTDQQESGSRSSSRGQAGFSGDSSKDGSGSIRSADHHRGSRRSHRPDQ